MTDGYRYAGPRVDRGDRARREVSARLRVFVQRRAVRIYDDAIKVWAQSDEGTYPTMAQAIAQSRAELQTLCNALGQWAAVHPESLMGGMKAPERHVRPARAWLDDWLNDQRG